MVFDTGHEAGRDGARTGTQSAAQAVQQQTQRVGAVGESRPVHKVSFPAHDWRGFLPSNRDFGSGQQRLVCEHTGVGGVVVRSPRDWKVQPFS